MMVYTISVNLLNFTKQVNLQSTAMFQMNPDAELDVDGVAKTIIQTGVPNQSCWYDCSSRWYAMGSKFQKAEHPNLSAFHDGTAWVAMA